MSSRRGRGEGSIYQRKDGLWCAQVTTGYSATGKQQRKTVYGESKKEVQEKLLKEQQRILQGLPEPSDMTLSVCVDYWLDATIKLKVRKSTLDRYRTHCEWIKGELGRVPVAQVSPFQVSTLYRTLSEKGLSEWDLHRVGERLRQILNHAVQFSLIPTNPAMKVPLPRPPRIDIRPMDREQVREFLSAAERDRLYPLYLLALDSGMRQGEIFGLVWEKIDVDRGEVFVVNTLTELRGHLEITEVKTKNSRRRIKLTPSTVSVLQERRKEKGSLGHVKGTGQLVFPDSEGGFLRKSNVIRRSFKPLLKRVGLEGFRFHDLRHTMATLLLLAGVNPKIVSERLGHSSIRITLDTYSHVLPTMQEQAAEELEKYLGFGPVAVDKQYPEMNDGSGI